MPPPTKIGKYEVLEQVGTGTFATVYKCRHPFLDRTLAVKVCTAQDETLRRRFTREAEIVADLDHPNVVRVFDFGISDEGPYIVQEFLDGEDLRAKIRDREPMTYLQRVSYLLHVAQGLAYAHSKGVVHRDIKPGNIRILGDDRVKIMDFGIAKLAHSEERLTKAGAILGTAGYLPPEQVLGRPADQRADIFSFGAMAYHLLTFHRPFPGDNVKELLRQVLKVDPEPLSTYWPGCPAELQAVLSKCMEKEPGDRYSSFSSVISELAGVATQLNPFDGAERDISDELPSPSYEISRPEGDAHGTIPLDSGPNRRKERWWRWLSGLRFPNVPSRKLKKAAGRFDLSFLDRFFGGRAAGATLAVVTAVLLIAVVIWAAGRRTSAEDVLSDLPQVASDGVEASRIGEEGAMVVAATPWGVVSRVSTADGTQVALPPERVTPLSLAVGPGRYRVEISNPYSETSEVCLVDVVASSVGRCEVNFYDMDAVEYFKEGGWWP